MDEPKKQGNPCPKLRANFASRLCFWWLLELFWYGSDHNLNTSDLYDVLPENLSESLGNQLEKSWNKELIAAQKQNRKASLWRAIIKTFGCSFLKYGVAIFILNIVKVLQPLLLGQLIWYFNPLSSVSLAEAYAYASGLIASMLLQTVIVRQAHLCEQEIGMRIKIACSSLIYRKVLRLSSTSANQAAGGTIINLLSNDLAKFELFCLHLHYTWIMPFVVLLVTCLIWLQLGVAAFVGVAFMIVQIVPSQVLWYKLTSKLRSKAAAGSDRRVLLIEEIINGIRAIKMYAWEKSFEQIVYAARKYEIDALLRRFYVRSARLAFPLFTHRAALFSSILVYVLQGNDVTADRLFSTVTYYVVLRTIVAQFFPEAVSLGAEVNVSVKRIERFLMLEEVEPSGKPLALVRDDVSISMKEVSASWEKTPGAITLCDIDISLRDKQLCAIVGPVGSGKSSILKLILNELQPISGEVSVRGRVSYASQEPWLFAGSVRENILFGESYDEKRYARVTRACALARDFERLPYGDKTLVGDRGISLSGGQCARVSFARAIYRDVDVYLLDGVLAAVDAGVGKCLFWDCIKDLLKDKTRVLVTHQVQYLKEVDSIVLVNRGRVEFQGSFQKLCENEQYLRYLPLSEDSEKMQAEESNVGVTAKAVLASPAALEKEERKEPQEDEELLAKGRVAKSLYLKYFKFGASYFTLTILALCFLFLQLSISGFDYWLAYWAKQEEKYLNLSNGNSTEQTTTPDRFLKQEVALGVCGGLILTIIVFSNVSNLLFYKTALRSSSNIHNRMFARLIRAPMQFFSTNPSGRMINRFSKDTGAVDDLLPDAMLGVLQRTISTVAIFLQILLINWWSIFPMLVVLYLFLKINDIYQSTVQDIKRLEGNARSPVFSLVNSSLLGLLTIRSCQAQEIITKEFDGRQDSHTAAHYLVLVTSSAFGFWLDMVAISFMAFIAYSFIFLNDSSVSAGEVGLALTQILSICGMLQFTMKQVAEAMAQMTSLERMLQFTRLEQEGPFETEPGRIPDKHWPDRGEIRFKNFYMKYSDEGEPILKNINFTIEPKMKVGIVGRTGAGKSSLASALFGLAKSDGLLLIDNVDIKNVGLHDLRTRVSVIPQEPMLFKASLRENLDPFHQHDDDLLWSVLREVELDRIVQSLDFPVDRGGSNLSLGQKQLVCLARTIIRRNKILVLDEATANVDPATDEFIQAIIRARFGDCTVLTIAHRLNTIMDCDKVLVLENGEAVEFERPHVLLQRNDGYFSGMVRQSGNAMSQHLRKMAEKAFDENSKDDSTIPVPNDEDYSSKL